MSTRMYRNFEAPNDGSQRLPIKSSPWHFERDVRMPLSQWELIIEFTKTIDPEKAETLERCSIGSFNNDDYLDISKSDISKMIDIMLELQTELEVSEPIVSLKDRVFHEIDHEFTNDAYKRMLEAVIAVYRESLRLGEPVCAYND